MILQNNLQGLQHLGIPVTDIHRSTAFYSMFGFVEKMSGEILHLSESIKVVMLQKDDLTIELFQLGNKEIESIKNRSDGYIDHLALNVLDINKAYSEIKSNGIEIIEEDAPVFLPFFEFGTMYFTIRGPDGEKIELNQILVSPRS